MKSTELALEKRGFAGQGAELSCSAKSFEEKLALLQSKTATERTIGARLLAKDSSADAITALIDALKKEKKLYCKIALCEALISIDEPSVSFLMEQLGKIGSNQHKTVPQEKFNKKSYPLPRDIVARTLGHMGQPALAALINTLQSEDISQLSEAIDAIGYICFYGDYPDVYNDLLTCYQRNQEIDLIRWKIVRAMSSFPESKDFLQQLSESEEDKGILLEIERSLRLSGRNV